MLAIAIGVSGIAGFVFFVAFKDSQGIEFESIAILASMPGFSFDTSGFLAVKIIDPWLIVYHSMVVFLTFLSSIVVIVSSLMFCKYAQHNQSHLSAATKEAMTQMTIILSIQAAVPIFVCFLPVCIFIFHSFFCDDNSMFPMMGTLAVFLFPSINSILVIIFMKSYREFLLVTLKSLFDLCRCKVEVTATN
uniref:G protein-coupled receptor n=1 Tax=Panagrellus redivivus TaxID=6233 RepID=A0A7E4VZN4_PANRE